MSFFVRRFYNTTTSTPAVNSVFLLKDWASPTVKPSMSTCFQGIPWIDWTLKKKDLIPAYLFSHLDQPDIQTEHERIHHNFSRSLFYTHGMLLFDRKTIPNTIPWIDTDEWIQSKLYPWKQSYNNNWHLNIRHRSIKVPYKEKINLSNLDEVTVELPLTIKTCNQVAEFLTSLPLLEHHFQPTNYTIKPLIDIILPLKPYLRLLPRDETKKYYCVVDVGTTRGPSPVQPENVMLKDIAWILFDQDGNTIIEQTMNASLAHPFSSYLFFLHWITVLQHYQAEIAAYNGAFDATVLCRWPYNPVATQLLSLWNHDVMYMAQNHLKSNKSCSLDTAYTKILKKKFDLKWHISINDCIGTKNLFIHLINQK